MRPPAEQLIRDYLNRLSYVAHRRLQSDDRRAFIARTRDFIERQSGARDMADPAAVMRILSTIGEPETVVEREYTRLAAHRSRGAGAGFWKPRPQGGRLGSHGRAATEPGSQDGVQPAGSSGGAPGAGLPAKPGWAGGQAGKAGRQLTGEIKVTHRPITSRWRPGEALQPQESGPQGAAAPGGAAAAGPPGGAAAADAAGAGGVPGAAGAGGVPAGTVAADGAPGAGVPAAAAAGGAAAGGGGTGDAAAAGKTTAFVTVPRQRHPRRIQPAEVPRDLARRAADAWHQHRLESIAVALMALSGLIYPIPVWLVGFLIWLLGAAVAVWSKLWAPLDKVTGIIGPVALVIVGTTTAFSLGGTRDSVHAYVHEALADSMYLIKLGALLGAGFLAWRASRGHRSRAEPPWARRHRR